MAEIIKDRGHDYKIIEVDYLGGDYGRIDYDRLEIRILKSLPPTQKDECLLHELCHLALNGTSLRLLFKTNADMNADEVEEEFVNNFSQRLYGILKDNKFIKERLLDAKHGKPTHTIRKLSS